MPDYLNVPRFFYFLQKKVSRLDKRNFLHLLNECRGLTTWYFWTNFLAALWADFIVAYLFILNHDKVICDSSFPSNFIFKWQETKASTFFLLLIVHYDNFTDFTVVWKETAQIRLCDGWWKTAQKYLKIKILFIILFVCLFFWLFVCLFLRIEIQARIQVIQKKVLTHGLILS